MQIDENRNTERCAAVTLKGNSCKQKSGKDTLHCPSHNTRIKQEVHPHEWLPTIIDHPKKGTQAYNWANWLRKHTSYVRCFHQLTDAQCEDLADKLGYSSGMRMLRQIESASVEGNAFVRVGRRQMRNPIELLATTVHEIMHCLLPGDINVALQESICTLVETSITKRLLLQSDFEEAVATAAAMHPANMAASAMLYDAVQQLHQGLQLLGRSGGSLSPLLRLQSLESVLKSEGIDHDALHVCRDMRERETCQALEYDAFFARGLPGPLSNDEVMLVHGVRGEVRTMMRLNSSNDESVYIGAFVSTESGRGHGTTAMKLLCKLVKALGMKFVDLHSEELPMLQKVYKSMGFKKIERLCDLYGEGRAGLFWRKNA
jgi:hypothetical protein